MTKHPLFHRLAVALRSRSSIAPSVVTVPQTFECLERTRRTRAWLRQLSAVIVIIPIFLSTATAATEPDGRTGQIQQPLVPADGQLWTKNSNHVPMCWHQLVQFADTRAQEEAKAFVAQTIQESWISLLNLKISWVDCPATGDEKHVRVMLRIGDANYNGTTIKTGMETLSTAAERLSPPPNDPPGLLMGFRRDWNRSDVTRAAFRSLILHEFGHILGFDHEYVRSDGASNVKCYTNELPPGAVTIGPPDPKSIMGWSYCTTALGTLSPDDVRSARSVYGTGRSGSNDFNNDGRGDILWYNSSTGESQIWFMSGSSRIGRATILKGAQPVYLGPPWRIAASRDFNGDGQSDLLWYNASTGEMQIWHMNGHTVIDTPTVLGENGGAAYVGPPFSIVGINDFNGDKKADIVWYNSSTGETQIWHMNDYALIDRATVLGQNGSAAYIGPPFSIVGTNDFNGDGKADILWHNSSTGEAQIWYMDDYKLITPETVRNESGAIYVGPPFRIVGTNDFNQDGAADILWHNDSTGETQMWFMNGPTLVRRATVDAVLDGGGAKVGPPFAIMSH